MAKIGPAETLDDSSHTLPVQALELQPEIDLNLFLSILAVFFSKQRLICFVKLGWFADSNFEDPFGNVSKLPRKMI